MNQKGYIRVLALFSLLAFIGISTLLIIRFSKPLNNSTAFISTPFSQKEEQTLERNPTKEVLSQEMFISGLESETAKTVDGYTGRIISGMAFLATDLDLKTQVKGKSAESNKSLFLVEARGLDDKVLSEIPLAVSDGVEGGDIAKYSYQKPGVAFSDATLPVGTNSLVLRVRSGKVLDRVYVEAWDPKITITNLPTQVSSTGSFDANIELLPSQKYFYYNLVFENIASIGGSMSPKSGAFVETLNLNNIPFTKTQQLMLKASTHSLFKRNSYEFGPITIQLSSDNIDVAISGGDKPVRTAGEEDMLSWSYLFYGIDTTHGLIDLCKEKNRCFVLTWSSDTVKFLKSAFRVVGKNAKGLDIVENTSIDNAQDLATSLTTQLRNIECSFGGNGLQTIKLEVLENGNLLGTATYTFTVLGKNDRPTVCKTSGSYFFYMPEDVP